MSVLAICFCILQPKEFNQINLTFFKSFLKLIVSSKFTAIHTSEFFTQALLIVLIPEKLIPSLFADFLISKRIALGKIFLK